jgi:transposase
MPRVIVVQLTDAQQAALLDARDHHPKPYVREQAAAILRIAAGHSIRQVALRGILKPRRQETVKLWVERFMAEGITGLLVRSGRGRKPAFSPSAPRR